MPRCRQSLLWTIVLAIAIVCPFAMAQVAPSSGQKSPGKTERIGSLEIAGASDLLKQAVEERGYRVALDGWSADFWFARQLKTASADVPGALYPELSNGELVGVANLPKGMTDFRGQEVPAGLYTLRYQLLPEDGNHMGVSPNPDFLLAIPAASDPNPEQHYLPKKLFALSAKSVGGIHPAVIALAAPNHPPSVSAGGQGMLVFSVALSSTGPSTSLSLGIVVHGTAGP